MKSRKIYHKSALVRCTENELKQLHKKATEADLSLSRFLVKSGLSDGQILSGEEKEEIKKLRFELRKIGTNLNQIAYALNATKFDNDTNPPIEEIKSVNKVVTTAVDKLLKLL